jgi:hypothetical protein
LRVRAQCTAPPQQDELAKSVTTEQGKTFQDAKGDVFRGLGECVCVCRGGGGYGGSNAACV